MLSENEVRAAIDALKAEDGEAALTILEEMLAAAAGAEGDSEEGDPVEELAGDETQVEELAEDTEENEEEENSRLARTLKAITGGKTVSESVSALRKVVSQHTALQRDHEALSLTARRELVAELIKLGAETPATAWKGDASKRIPVERLARESVESMRARVTALSKVRPAAIRPPRSTEDGEDVKSQVSRLSRATLSQIKKQGITPEEFIARRESLRANARRIG